MEGLIRPACINQQRLMDPAMVIVCIPYLCRFVQARPAEGHHHHMSYIGTITRRHLLQGPSDGPPGTVPEDDVEIMDTQADAAYAPMSAMSEPHTTYETHLESLRMLVGIM